MMHSTQPTKLVKLSAAIWLGILTSACQTTGSVATSALLFCDAAKPIYWSTRDTPDTAAQVQEHNAVGKTGCDWK